MNGIYVHIPFCVKKCTYCDFVSYENRLCEAEDYVRALLCEMETYRGVQADTVYIGGGTPTAIPPHLLVRLLQGIKNSFVLAPNTEITVEANPGTCDAAFMTQLAEVGVNRVSLGAQSFVDAELATIGRIHTAAQIAEAVGAVRSAGISNISLDLMFSLPGQTKESLRYSLDRLYALEPNHVSCYSLTLCEGTHLYEMVKAGKVMMAEDEEDRELYAMVCEHLKQNGYCRYEISNFARGGAVSRHNTKYWKRAPYIGLGVAAHSFYKNCRFENPVGLSDYYRVVCGKEERPGESISWQDAMAEFMFLGLRMTEEGVLKQEFYKTFGKTVESIYGPSIAKLCEQGLLECVHDRLRLTDRGIDVSNRVFCEFL